MYGVIAVDTTLLGLSGLSSSPIITTSLWAGTLLVLFPLGVTRGIIQSVQDICQLHGRPALQQALEQAPSSQFLVSTQEGNRQLLERLTMGSGWQGTLIRTIASPVLPSTAQMMVRLQELADRQAMDPSSSSKKAAVLDSHVLVEAADGFVEGFLQDKKDTITTLGLLGYAGIVGIGLGVDYSYRRAKSGWQQHPAVDGGSGLTPESDGTKPGDDTTSSPPIDIRSMKKYLGLHSGEETVISPSKSPPPSKEDPEITYPTSTSIGETVEAAQQQVGEMIRLVIKGKEQADPYLQQAMEIANAAKAEMTEQASQLMDEAKQVMLDESNQKQFQEHWKTLTNSMQDLSPDDATVERMTREMENALRQAQKRLNQDDVQEMRRELAIAMEQAQKRIAQERANAKVDEQLEQVRSDLQYKFFQWWWRGGGSGGSAGEK